MHVHFDEKCQLLRGKEKNSICSRDKIDAINVNRVVNRKIMQQWHKKNMRHLNVEIYISCQKLVLFGDVWIIYSDNIPGEFCFDGGSTT